MFTGIITDLGTIKTISGTDARRLEIAAPWSADLAIGASVALNGACMTVTEKTSSSFFVDVSPESIRRTLIGTWKAGDTVHLERALKMGDELGGHIVTGHVDGLATLKSVAERAGAHQLVFEAPKELAPLVAEKGSVTLDGVSLTVNGVRGYEFDITLIPHTWQVTNFSKLKVGGKVHMEADILARYAARVLEFAKENA